MAKPFGSTSIAVRETEHEPFYRQLFARSGFGYAALDETQIAAGIARLDGVLRELGA